MQPLLERKRHATSSHQSSSNHPLFKQNIQVPTHPHKPTTAHVRLARPQPDLQETSTQSANIPAPPTHTKPHQKQHVTLNTNTLPQTHANTSSAHSFPTCSERSPANDLLRPALASRPRTQALCLTKALTSTPGGCPLLPWLGAGCVVNQTIPTSQATTVKLVMCSTCCLKNVLHTGTHPKIHFDISNSILKYPCFQPTNQLTQRPASQPASQPTKQPQLTNSRQSVGWNFTCVLHAS